MPANANLINMHLWRQHLLTQRGNKVQYFGIEFVSPSPLPTAFVSSCYSTCLSSSAAVEDEGVNTPMENVWCVLRFYCTQTCCSTAEAPPTPSNMVPVSSRVLKDKLISVPTLSNTPLSSTYPGLEKLTVYRFCITQRKKVVHSLSNKLGRMEKIRMKGMLVKKDTLFYSM